MAKIVSLHSYKGGTGKTTLAVNLAALLASQNKNVLLVDMDVYAPSLYVYFSILPKRWINDYLNNKINLEDVIYDYSDIFRELSVWENEESKRGLFHVIFSNPAKNEITNLDSVIRKDSSKSQMVKKMLDIRVANKNVKYDYIFLDTSPGIRYWSINSLAISDIILLSLKMDNIDVEGTKHMAMDVYDSFTAYGAKSYLLLNRVAGYCIPDNLIQIQSTSHTISDFSKSLVREQSDVFSELEKKVKMKIISTIPCYCDIQFQRQEYLTVLKDPNHPFVEKIGELANIL